ncbi:MAG: putative IMPACT (imprinted ancient) family translation regulator [Sulfitobacter sp.]
MTELRIIDGVISDRGSKYSVSGCAVASRVDVDAALKALKKNKKFAKATHNSWGVLLPGGPLKSDDGEAGAGNVILAVLDGAGIEGQLVIVTRWFGGKHLGGDRFRHVREATKAWLNGV